jgi:4-hydroxybenzoate polyprenyltransferase
MQYLSVLILQGLLFPVLCLALWPGVTRAILGDLRLPRVLHYVVLAGLGAALWLRVDDRRMAIFQDIELWMRFGLLVLCLLYAAVFAIVTNNLEDLEADRISNRGRPLVQGRVDARSYLLAGIACEVVALVLAFAAGWQMGFGILAISVGYFVYSCRPLRLKRIPILSKMLIGFNSLCVAVCGYALAGGDWRAFPLIWLIFILGPLSLAANFVDLKDTAGDRAQGVATLPVLLGEPLARHLIAAATLATYFMGALLLDILWVYPLNIMGAGMHVFFLYRKPYDERWVFLILVSALAAMDLFLFF